MILRCFTRIVATILYVALLVPIFAVMLVSEALVLVLEMCWKHSLLGPLSGGCRAEI